MGELLKDEFKDEIYAIGVFAGSGVSADNFRREETLSPPDSDRLDIKHIIQSLNGFAHYLPVPEQAYSGSEWLFEDIIVNDTFINLYKKNTMNLSKKFDALILLQKVSLPEYRF